MRDSLIGWFTGDFTVSNFDPNHHGVYNTTNGGLLWKEMVDSAQWNSVYEPSPGNLLVSNGGFAFEDSLKGMVCVAESPLSSRRFIFPSRTFNGGRTWIPFTFPNPPIPYTYRDAWDIYCQRSTKEYYVYGEGARNGFTSTDFGLSWKSFTLNNIDCDDPSSGKYPNQTTGGIAGVGDAIYLQTECGLYRSLDRAATWVSIGGPVNGADCRINVPPVCNGAVVIAVGIKDSMGGAWMTTDGGDGTIPLPDDTLTLGSVRFDTISACDTSIAALAFSNCGCTPADYHFDSASVSGDSRFSMMKTALFPKQWNGFASRDSLRVRFAPSHQNGPASATLHLYGRIIRDSVVTPFDSVVTLSAYSHSAITLQGPNTLDLGAINLCGSGRDSVIRVTNRGCSSVTFTTQDFNDNGFAVDTLTLPLTLGRDSTIVLHVHSLPLDTNTLHGSITLHATTGENTQSVTLQMLARGARSDGLLELATNALDLGSRTICQNDSLVFDIRDGGCDSLVVDPASYTGDPDFSVAAVSTDSVIDSHGVIHYRVYVNPKTLGLHHGKILLHSHSLKNPGVVHDTTIDVTAQLTLAAKPLAVTAPNVRDITFCQSDSEKVPVTNQSCDSLRVHAPRLSGNSDYHAAPQGDTLLAPGETAWYTIFLTPTAKGQRSATARIQAEDLRYGVASGDTTISFTSFVSDGNKILAADKATIDFGLTSICEDLSKILDVQNTGCDTLTITAADLQSKGFVVTSSTPLPIVLAPDSVAKLTLTTVTDTTGHPTTFTDRLTIQSTAQNALLPIAITRSIVYPTHFSLTIAKPDSARAGGGVSFDLNLTGTVPASVTALHFDLAHDDDLLGYQSLTGAGLTLDRTNGVGANMTQSFTLSPVSVGAVGSLRFQTYLARTDSTPLTLSNVRFDAQSKLAPDCIASTDESNTAFRYIYSCGDRTAQLLLESLPIHIESITPNPAQNEVQVNFAYLNADARMELCDVLGNIVSQRTVAHGTASTKFSLTEIPTGTYYMRVSSGGFVETRKVMVVH